MSPRPSPITLCVQSFLEFCSTESMWSNSRIMSTDVWWIFLAVLGLELSASCALSVEPLCQPFLFGYFWDRISLYAQAGLEWVLLFVLPCIAGMTGTYHRVQPLIETGAGGGGWSHELFPPSWPQLASHPPGSLKTQFALLCIIKKLRNNPEILWPKKDKGQVWWLRAVISAT
jgi:hypothetical protein